MVDGMVERMKQEMNTTPMVIATGGLSPLIADVSNAIESVDLALTLDGLKIISRAL